MCRRIVLATLAAFLLAAPGLAQKIYIDFDGKADLSDISTYKWHESDEDLRDTNELGHRRVIAAIESELLTRLDKVDSNPDLYITYHTAEKEGVRINSSSMNYGYSPYWRRGGYWGGGYGNATTTVTNYTEGTLVIDVWDAREKKMIWRGIATSVVPTSPGKAEKKLDKALRKMAKKWAKMRDSAS
jgi:hypothetical protein